jgi:hypothetical protein
MHPTDCAERIRFLLRVRQPQATFPLNASHGSCPGPGPTGLGSVGLDPGYRLSRDRGNVTCACLGHLRVTRPLCLIDADVSINCSGQ